MPWRLHPPAAARAPAKGLQWVMWLLPLLCRELTSHALKPHLILRMMGLEHCADTLVGNQMVR